MADRPKRKRYLPQLAALDNISATEWRQHYETAADEMADLLHSIISVLPNGGYVHQGACQVWHGCTR